MPNTKIVATLGPATDSEPALRHLFAAGVDVFRLNFSHGTQREHAVRIANLRRLAADLNPFAAILLDLQGPKIRLGAFTGGAAELVPGAPFTITTEPVPGTAAIASTTYAAFARDVQPGDRVLLADGTLELQALRTDGVAVDFTVMRGGRVSDHKGINLPGVAVSAPSVTAKDVADLEFGLRHGIDYVALSFVRHAKDVLHLKSLLGGSLLGGSGVPVVAKIEKPEAWENLDEILEAADGIMVARGDLGVEVALEKVPYMQKSMIQRARERGRFVITATQMLESMIESSTPTRAEVSDVANAICDGTDAVMLSAETSVGQFPAGAVTMMARIAGEIEAGLRPPELRHHGAADAEIVADAAFRAASRADVSAIAVFTTTGATARLISRLRPRVPVYAFTPDVAVARRLALLYAVRPFVVEHAPSTDAMLGIVDSVLVGRGCVQPGAAIVFVAGQPVGRPGNANMMTLHRAGAGRR